MLYDLSFYYRTRMRVCVPYFSPSPAVSCCRRQSDEWEGLVVLLQVNYGAVGRGSYHSFNLCPRQWRACVFRLQSEHRLLPREMQLFLPACAVNCTAAVKLDVLFVSSSSLMFASNTRYARPSLQLTASRHRLCLGPHVGEHTGAVPCRTFPCH
jgi:hypothetical protein